MMTRFNSILSFLILINTGLTLGQIENPVTWEFSKKQITKSEFELIFTANIDDQWHLYGTNLPEGGPVPTSFYFNISEDIELVGDIVEMTKAEEKYDPTFEMDLKLFSHTARFKQKVKIKSDKDVSLTGAVEFMSCDDSRCLPPREVDFEFNLSGNMIVKETKQEEADDNESPKIDMAGQQLGISVDEIVTENETEMNEPSKEEGGAEKKNGLLAILLLSIIGGLGALITPCVYPMIPMTVSYFLRGEKKRSVAITEALIFGVSIVLIYTSLGVVVALIKNVDFINTVTSHWVTNTLFAAIFILLAASFFGMFEIVLPSSMANRVDQKADRGGYLGAFFMALGMTILSFSCTGPIVALLLIRALEGAVLEPIVGMFAFSAIFALPFTLFAISPSLLKSLPKSGGWLNAVKVFFAFIMFAFAFYFISKIDQVYHLNILSREIYLAIWIVTFLLLGLYLIGKLKFSHDSELTHIGFPRLVLGIASFVFVVYMIPGLFGAPLKGISPLLPPKESHSFDLVKLISENKFMGDASVSEKTKLCGEPKYADFLHLPHNLEGYFDYEEGMACAKERGKPVLLDFKGHTCTNCKAMEEKVWSHPEVLSRLKNDFIIIALYVDDKTKLPDSEWITSAYDGKVKKTMGKKNLDFQITGFGTNTQPYYVLVDHDGKKLTDPKSMDLNIDNFITFLDKGKKAFKK